MRCLARLPLRSLSLVAFPRMSDWTIGMLGQHVPQLLTLHLDLCTRLTNRALEYLSELFPALQDLSLHCVATVDDAGVMVRPRAFRDRTPRPCAHAGCL